MDLGDLVRERQPTPVDEDDDNLNDLEEALKQAQLQQLRQPSRSRQGGTGVKGVLADYAEAKEKTRLRREARAEALYLQMKDRTITIKPTSQKSDSEEEDEDGDDRRQDELDPDSDEFIKLYRERRLKELQDSQRPSFGYLKDITAWEFADEIDNEIDSSVFVIIHLYQDYLASCVRMNYVLQKLAQKFHFVKFLKIVSTEAEADYDDVALPTLLVYKKGDLVRSFIRIIDELPQSWDQDDVESLLVRFGILPAYKASMKARATSSNDEGTETQAHD